MTEPLFLSFDGLDGSGKSTQCQRLVDRLRSLGVTVTHAIDPGGTALGAKLREILLFGKQYDISLRTEALLFMASRAELVEQVIRPALHRGEVVLSDRYLLANVVYQAHAGGLDASTLWDIGHFATDNIEPNLTLIFDIPTDVARERRKRDADRMESRGADFHDRVRQGFLTEAAHRPEQFHVVDARESVETIEQHVWQVVAPVLKTTRHLART